MVTHFRGVGIFESVGVLTREGGVSCLIDIRPSSRRKVLDLLAAGRSVASLSKVDPEPPRDLLGAPRCRPPSILSGPMTATHPTHLGAWHQLAIGAGDNATETILHIPAKLVVPRRASPPSDGRRADPNATERSWPRHSKPPQRVAALRPNSREIVDAQRPRRRAISPTPQSRAWRTAISSRSTKDK